MTVMSIQAERRDFTVDDLDAMPDDGRRYELLDGSLIVTPPPHLLHQGVLQRLNRILLRAHPPGVEVLFAPTGVSTSHRTWLEPDLLVARDVDFAAAKLSTAPLLAVEILSPSTRHIDLGLKRNAYEALGTTSYWVVDPAVPSIIVWELVDGAYVEAGRAEGDMSLEPTLPFPVRIVPSQLVP